MTISDQDRQYVVFTINEEAYSLSIDEVVEIIRMQKVTKIMGSKAYILGVMNVRGKIIPLVDLKIRYQLPQNQVDKRTRIIIISLEGEEIGLIVDEVNMVTYFEAKDVEIPHEMFNTIEKDCFLGFAKVGEKVIGILNLNKILYPEHVEGGRTVSEMDMSLYLGVFLDEVDEQLQILDECILQLERENENMETIQRVFRATHTLKGSSAAMGFDKLKELTHKVENVFDAIRHGQLFVNKLLIDTIFEAIDCMKLLKTAIIEGNLDDVDIEGIIGKINDLMKHTSLENLLDDHKTVSEEDVKFPEVTLSVYQKSVIEQALNDRFTVFAIYVSLSKKSLLKQVRAFLIQNNLKEIGEVIGTFPDQQEIENEETFNGHLVFLLVTKESKQTVIHIVNSIADIETVSLDEITDVNVEKTIQKDAVEAMMKSQFQQTNTKQLKTDKKFNVHQTVRVDIERLEYLMNLVGELVIDQTRITEMKNKLLHRYPEDEELEQFQEVENHLAHVISELQEGMMKTRMLPIEQLFNRFPRMVRDLTQKANKKIDFTMEGNETELDRRLIEEISDPIIHLLRNSIDHGIESPEEREKLGKPKMGRVYLKAVHEDNHIVITVSDDGKGIDPDKIKEKALKKGVITEEDVQSMTEKDFLYLIFQSGISTASKVTEISGRGVGMDIVRSQIEKLNGMIEIDSVIGQGTTFTIKLPLTLAIIRSLLIQIGSSQFAIPLGNVSEIIRIRYEEMNTIKGKEVANVRGRILPLVRLHKQLGEQEIEIQNQKRLFVVIVGIAEKRVGLIVDKMLGNQDIVIKSLGKYVGTPPYIAGATIMGNGEVSLILDIASIIQRYGTKDLEGQSYKSENKEKSEERQIVSFLLDNEEYALSIDQVIDIITVSEITKVMTAPSAVLGMINVRGLLIPVVDMRKRFAMDEAKINKKSRIIVVQFAEKRVGLLVDQVKEVLKVRKQSLELAPDHINRLDAKYIEALLSLTVVQINQQQKELVLVGIVNPLAEIFQSANIDVFVKCFSNQNDAIEYFLYTDQ